MPEHDANSDEIRARPFWSGTISFGLVSVPVDLYSGNRPRAVSLRMLDEDGTPLARRYFCPEEERELGPDEIVRGYEVEKDEFIVVSDEELESLEPRKSRDIDLRLFVDASAIDPFYFERSYFLAPAGESSKAYRLLAQTMEQTGRAGIATFVMREREYLVAILAENGVLRAETLRFHNEVRTPEDVGLDVEANGVPAAEVRKIEKAIEKLTESKLDPAEMQDDYAKALIQLVEQKLEAEEDVVASVPAEPEEEESVVDLMELLKERMRTSVERAPAPRAAKRAAAGELESASKAELYERAKKLDIEGRSSMSKQELIRAIRSAA